MNDDEKMRLECVRLAVEAKMWPDTVIDEADRIYAYVKTGQNPGSAPADAREPPSDNLHTH